MPDLTFLALENPLGILGTKIKGVINTETDLAPLAKLINKKSDASNFRVDNFIKTGKPDKDEHKYENRYTRLKNDDNASESFPKILPTFVEDVLDNREIVLRLLRTKVYPYVRLAMCSSLTSTMNYIQNYRTANPNDQFDTLILYGHGSPGSINMGTSKWTIGPAKQRNEEGYKDRKLGRENFGLEEPRIPDDQPRKPLRVRSLNTHTKDGFLAKFSQLFDNECFVQNDSSGHFHIFLMGCKVGGEEQTFTKDLAKSIARETGLPMCVSAPTDQILPLHLHDLLKHLADLRRKCAQQAPCKLDDKVPLTSSVASP